MSVVHNAVLTCLFSSLVFSTQTNSTLIFSWADTPHKGFGKQLGDNPQRHRRESGENMWQYQERENSANCEIAHWLLLWWTDWIPAWGSSRNLTEQCWIQYQRRGEHHLWGCDLLSWPSYQGSRLAGWDCRREAAGRESMESGPPAGTIYCSGWGLGSLPVVSTEARLTDQDDISVLWSSQ